MMHVYLIVQRICETFLFNKSCGFQQAHSKNPSFLQAAWEAIKRLCMGCQAYTRVNHVKRKDVVTLLAVQGLRACSAGQGVDPDKGSSRDTSEGRLGTAPS